MSTVTTVGQVLQTALETVYPGAVFPDVYQGPLTEYVVWNYNAFPALWAERTPQAARYLVQVHLYSPRGKNPQTAILSLSRALFGAKFTWPSLTDASDAEGQHHVLECEYCDGGGFYGYC